MWYRGAFISGSHGGSQPLSVRLDAHAPGPNAQEGISPQEVDSTPLINTNSEKIMDEALLDPDVDPEQFGLEQRMEFKRKNTKNRLRGQQNPGQALSTSGDGMLIKGVSRYNSFAAELPRNVEMPSNKTFL